MFRSLFFVALCVNYFSAALCAADRARPRKFILNAGRKSQGPGVARRKPLPATLLLAVAERSLRTAPTQPARIGSVRVEGNP